MGYTMDSTKVKSVWIPNFKLTSLDPLTSNDSSISKTENNGICMTNKVAWWAENHCQIKILMLWSLNPMAGCFLPMAAAITQILFRAEFNGFCQPRSSISITVNTPSAAPDSLVPHYFDIKYGLVVNFGDEISFIIQVNHMNPSKLWPINNQLRAWSTWRA
jgi:hypothetical protein